MSKEQMLFDLLDNLDISVKVYEHEPLYTVEQAKVAVSHIPGVQVKNLFLKDDKGRFYLVIAQADTHIKLKALAKKLNAPNLRFAKPELLKECLGVEPGGVTPFGLINDAQHAVTVVLETAILKHTLTGFHPLRNDATVTITPTDFVTFINHLGNQLIMVEFNQL